jgi:aldose 1-epimerase
MASPSSAVFEFLPLGAIIQTFLVGETNIVQNFPKQELYQIYNTPCFGETIGRVANRLKDAKIKSLNGTSYTLAANNGPNNLHGGVVGWGKKIWDGPTPVGMGQIPSVGGCGLDSVMFRLKSEDGDEGFPGTIEARVTYTAGTQTTGDRKNVQVLGIEYEAELLGGADETVINMTNHS